MSIASRSVRSLSIGAALVTCSLASAGGLVPLNFSTVDSASGIINLGSTTGTFSYTGPSSYMGVTLAVGAGSGTGSAYAGGINVPGFDVDIFAAVLNTNSYYTAGIWTATFIVTVNQTAFFSDLTMFGASTIATWQMDSAAVTNGQLIGIGQHTFTGTFIYSGAPDDVLGAGFALYNPAAAVPLPGAAGLAAVGLAGLSRRRRR